MKIKNIFEVWKDVFSNWKYSLIAIVFAIGFYVLNVLLNAYESLFQYYENFGFLSSIIFFLKLILGFNETILFHSFVTILIISVLLGVLVSLIYYKTKMIESNFGNEGFFATAGIFLGILAPGCAACGIGIISALGLSAAVINFLPYDGLELSFLAIGILILAIVKISKDIKRGIICEINVNSI